MPTTQGQSDFQFQADANSAVQYLCTGTIGDFVWHDQNRNGLQDSGEPGIDGVKVTLLKASDNSLIATTTTGLGPLNQHGYYQFNGVCAGDYKVEVTTPSGFSPTSPCSADQTIGNDSNCSPAPVTLTTDNSSNQTIDFGFVTPCTGSIGDYVWHDKNRNGIQDDGELAGLNGETVNLFKASDLVTPIATTTTGNGPGGSAGYYQFTGLCAGNYVVTVATPAGFTPTTANAPGSTPANDSNGSPASVTLPTDNSSDQTIDFGFVTPCTGTIGDFVWLDQNYNSLQDAGEPGIDGVVINLFRQPGDVLIATTATAVGPGGKQGYYQFTGLCGGNYTVESIPPTGLSRVPLCSADQTIGNDSNCSPAPVNLPDDNSSNQTIDFGFESACSGTIGDFVWEDLNANGLQDNGEPGINGVTVNLRKLDNTIIATTTTAVGPGGQDGYYQFPGLCAGDFQVEVVTPSGYKPTTPCSADQAIPNDSNCSPAPVNLPWNDSSNQTIDFGFIKLVPNVTIIKYTNGADANDPNAAGVPNIAPGGVVTWTYKVTNTGNVSVPKAQVVVTDSQTGVTPSYDSEISGNGDAMFDPGEVWQFKATGTALDLLLPPPAGVTVKPGVCTAGGTQPPRTAYTNVGTVTIPGASATDPSSYCNPPSPNVTIIKYTNGADANDPNAAGVPNITPGGVVTWTYKVTNTGNVSVAKAQVVVTDSQTGVTPTYDSEISGNGDAMFDPGEVWLFKATGTALDLTLPPPAGVTVKPGVCTAGGTQPPRTAYTNVGTVTVPGASATDPSSYCNPPPTYCLGDFVWNDLNRNGIQENGESGIAGVTVQLYNCAGALIATTTTDANGFYQFCGLLPGSYQVKFTAPSGYVFSPQYQGGNPALDSNANSTGLTECISITNQSNFTIDAGLYKPNLGCVYTQGYWKTHSKYGPAPYDATWAKLPQGEETLFFDTGKTWYQIITAVPKDGDAYLILAHQYIAAYLNGLNGADLSFVSDAYVHAAYLLGQYDGNPQPMSAITGSVRDDFITTAYVLDEYNNGLIGPPHCGTTNEPKASVGNFVWVDTNKNGLQDSGEAGLASVVVNLRDCAGNFVATATTSSSGTYLFSNLMPGEYKVEFVKPAGYVFTTPDVGSDNSRDSDANVTTGMTACFSLAPGQTDLTWDAGVYKSLNTIGDFVWNDTNKNGLQDKGEPGINGVKVSLYTCSGTFVAQTVTQNSGLYFFNVQDGSYYLKFDLLTGYQFSPKDVGTNNAIDSDVNASGQTTCFTVAGKNDLTWDAGMYDLGSGCTYTPGYWKTHSKYGPAPYDPTWAGLEDSAFFSYGKSWYQTIWAEPKGGDAYLILAHQYIAAYLNKLNGASTSAITATLDHAKVLLDTYDTNQSAIKGSVRTDFINTATTLDQYNNGLIGPGHCSNEVTVPYMP